MRPIRPLFFFVLALLCSTLLSAQNGGQASENNSIKIEQVGLQLKITNKQACTATERYTLRGVETVTATVVVAAQSSVYITVPGWVTKIQAKTETNCGGADFGQVELTYNTSLPITFTKFFIRKKQPK